VGGQKVGEVRYIQGANGQASPIADTSPVLFVYVVALSQSGSKEAVGTGPYSAITQWCSGLGLGWAKITAPHPAVLLCPPRGSIRVNGKVGCAMEGGEVWGAMHHEHVIDLI